MYPKLYNSSGQVLAVLDNIIKETASIKRVVNGEFTFNFSAYEKELKSEYFDPANALVVDGQTFDIKYIEQEHETDVQYAIQCEHVNYRMEDGEENLFPSYAYTGTPTQILSNILAGTEFSVGTVEFTDTITITVNTEITRKSLIYELANELGGEVDYTNLGFTINILASIGKNNGFQARFGKNLKGIRKIIDNRGGLKTYYSVDIITLKNSNEYIEKELRDLETIDVGDTIQLIDPVIGLDLQNRILSREYNPIFEVNTKLEIANNIELITTKIKQIETSTVHKNKIYNGVYISAEDGFVAERSDEKVKTIMNATEGISIYSDLGSGFAKNFFVGLDGRIQAKGIDIDGSGTFSGELNAAGGTFTGDLSAAGGTFSGDLSAAGGTFSGDLDAAGGTFSGDLSAAGGTFSGNLSAAGGTFSGELQGATGLFTGTVLVGGSDGTLQITGESSGGTGQLEFYKGLSTSAPDIIIRYNSEYNSFEIMDFGLDNSCYIHFYGDISLWSRGDIDLDPWGRLYYNGDEVATETWCYNNFLLYGENEYVSSYFSDQKITLAATDLGIVVRVNGAVKGNLVYE